MNTNLFKIKQLALLLGTSLVIASCSQNAGNNEAAGAENGVDQPESTAQTEGADKMMELMHENMSKMQEVKLTGDADIDFSNLMATHHEGGIKMAEEEVNSGTDTMLVNMAQKSIPKQKEEQDKLQEHAASKQPASSDTASTKVLVQPMKDMMANMSHSMAGTKDHNFAKLTSMHHQSAIDMVQAYLPLAKVPEIKAMAQKIMEEQQKEKRKLDEWLQQNPQ